jgi:hypothetical protein
VLRLRISVDFGRARIEESKQRGRECMGNFEDTLVEMYRAKKKAGTDKAQQQFEYTQFIDGHGFEAWQEIMEKARRGCEAITKDSGDDIRYSREQDGFIIAGGTHPLDVEFNMKTKSITWKLRHTEKSGKLTPDRRANELIYREDGDRDRNNTYTAEEVAAALVQKVF